MISLKLMDICDDKCPYMKAERVIVKDYADDAGAENEVQIVCINEHMCKNAIDAYEMKKRSTKRRTRG